MLGRSFSILLVELTNARRYKIGYRHGIMGMKKMGIC